MLPCSLYFQMFECQNTGCKKRINSLQELLQKQSQAHTAEVRKIEQSLQEFASAKQKQCYNYQTILDKMKSKIDKYKAKCCSLNEKTKEYADTIKVLNNRISALEDALKLSKEENHLEKNIGLQQIRINSELRQIITLQQAENRELNLRRRLFEQEIQSLQSQLALKSINEAKIKNAEYVSEEQYQRQVNLLRENLKLEFSRSTEQLFSTLPRSGFNLTEQKQQEQTSYNQADQQLRILGNLTEYGRSFLQMYTQNEVKLPSSKKIYYFLKELSIKNQQLHQQIQDLRTIRDQLTQQMRSKLNQIQQIVVQKPIQTYDATTQTPNNDSIEKLTSINGFYRIKIIEFQQIMNLLVYFGAYAYHLAHYHHKKISYFKKAANNKLKKLQNGLKNRFRAIAFSIFFIQLLKKKARKGLNRKQTFIKYSIENSTLQRMLLQCLIQRENYNRKNPVLERLARQKATVTSEGIAQNFMSSLSEQAIGLSLSKSFPFNSSHYDINYF